MRKLLKVGLVGLMSAGLLVGASVPAHASQTYGFNVSTGYSEYVPNDGNAHAKGTITFHGRNAFTANIGVRDLCAPNGKGDGFGAYTDVRIRFMDGTQFAVYGAKDTNGCGTAFVWNKKYHQFGKRIRWVQVLVHEIDAERNYNKDTGTSRLIDNPYTG
ncbi:hypothetical protein [Zhihengliuella sp.]|uniref:hypothetical protein n=1 Tax=Zhihengliuella sp. TaxID=1954483 RepID=UPI002811CD94|nr:hypothetical protein [Zhihengliuella sp.]